MGNKPSQRNPITLRKFLENIERIRQKQTAHPSIGTYTPAIATKKFILKRIFSNMKRRIALEQINALQELFNARMPLRYGSTTSVEEHRKILSGWHKKLPGEKELPTATILETQKELKKVAEEAVEIAKSQFKSEKEYSDAALTAIIGIDFRIKSVLEYREVKLPKELEIKDWGIGGT